jgi:hypothetical protein
MVPIFQYHGWHTGLIALGKAIAPLGILITLFLNFTSAHLTGNQVKTDSTIEFRQIENAMALVAKYDSDDFLAAKQWLKYQLTNEIDPKEVKVRLSKIKEELWLNLEKNGNIVIDLELLQTNVYISIKRYLNYLDEVRIATTGDLPFAKKELVYESIAVPIVLIYDLLDEFIKQEQGFNIVTTYEGKSWYMSDHQRLKRDLKSYINGKQT